ncbi:hypothetical protein [Leptotrichia trevisanii]|uniref:hypothetical protein n=1 Tax=Leptotrichia trevisanii TaxID=109328 RepID=UPI0026EDF265|nr:hypothetical protein [Leptotrichia trevisanii]
MSEQKIEKIQDMMVDKVVEKVAVSKTGITSNQSSSLNFNVIDYKRDYSRSNIYADVNYRDNFRGDRELLARAGFIYYLK